MENLDLVVGVGSDATTLTSLEDPSIIKIGDVSKF